MLDAISEGPKEKARMNRVSKRKEPEERCRTFLGSRRGSAATVRRQLVLSLAALPSSASHLQTGVRRLRLPSLRSVLCSLAVGQSWALLGWAVDNSMLGSPNENPACPCDNDECLAEMIPQKKRTEMIILLDVIIRPSNKTQRSFF